MATGFALLNIEAEGILQFTRSKLYGIYKFVCLLKSMEKKLINRVPNPEDGRSVLIFLTQFGKEKRDDSRSVVLNFNNVIENQLSDIQIKHFFEVAECIMKESKKFEHFLID